MKHCYVEQQFMRHYKANKILSFHILYWSSKSDRRLQNGNPLNFPTFPSKFHLNVVKVAYNKPYNNKTTNLLRKASLTAFKWNFEGRKT